MQAYEVSGDVKTLLIRHVRRTATYLLSCDWQVRTVAADCTKRVGARCNTILASPTSSAVAVPVISLVSWDLQIVLILLVKRE